MPDGLHNLEPAFLVADTLGQHVVADEFDGLDSQCKDIGSWGVYGPGEMLGPTPMCVQVADPSGPLTLEWLSSKTGQSVEVQFP